jgi:hypothetical protein
MMKNGNGSRSTRVRRVRRRKPVPLREPERRGEAQVDVRPKLARPVSFREAYECRRVYWEAPDPRKELERIYEDAPDNATGDVVALLDKRLERERRNRKFRVIDIAAAALTKGRR